MPSGGGGIDSVVVNCRKIIAFGLWFKHFTTELVLGVY
jgi:hypothetical protein